MLTRCLFHRPAPRSPPAPSLSREFPLPFFASLALGLTLCFLLNSQLAHHYNLPLDYPRALDDDFEEDFNLEIDKVNHHLESDLENLVLRRIFHPDAQPRPLRRGDVLETEDNLLFGVFLYQRRRAEVLVGTAKCRRCSGSSGRGVDEWSAGGQEQRDSGRVPRGESQPERFADWGRWILLG